MASSKKQAKDVTIPKTSARAAEQECAKRKALDARLLLQRKQLESKQSTLFRTPPGRLKQTTREETRLKATKALKKHCCSASSSSELEERDTGTATPAARRPNKNLPKVITVTPEASVRYDQGGCNENPENSVTKAFDEALEDFDEDDDTTVQDQIMSQPDDDDTTKSRSTATTTGTEKEVQTDPKDGDDDSTVTKELHERVVAGLATEKQELEKELQKQKNMVQDQSSTLSRLSAEASANDTLRTDLNSQKEELRKTQKAYEQLQKTTTGSQKKQEAADKKVKALQGQVKKLKEALEKAKEKGKAGGTGSPKLLQDNATLKSVNAALKKEVKKLEKDKTSLSTSNTKLQAKIDELEKELKQAKEELEASKTQQKNAQSRLNKYTSALKSSGKSSPAEMSATVKKASREYLKEVVYRTSKFVSSQQAEEVKKLCQRVYDGIKDDLGLADKNSTDYLPFDEFQRIYHKDLLQYHSTQRSNTATACQKAVIEFYKAYGRIPTVEAMKDVYKILKHKQPNEPPEPAEDAELTDEEKKELKLWNSWARGQNLLLWYLDFYLPAAAGEQSFGRNIRHYKHACSAIEYKGKMRIAVEKASEAYGLLIYENNYERWLKIVPEKAQDEKWRAPTYNKDDPDTHAWHQTKFSEPYGGQTAGWKPEGRVAMNEYLKLVKTFRDLDKSKKFKYQRKALKWLRQHNGVTEDSPMPKSKKRKAKNKPTVEKIKFVKVDESEDEPEVPDAAMEESETSSGETSDPDEEMNGN